ncbi:cation diffusion facilitator family transporter [Lentilactobacillus sunkii]|uniref:Cation diffusion facilitator family transporter n=1 Tax=Lentilactobacillus sunkii DSM 19904 TaxID=1423808 RepID=A0A0R1L6B0_9LACO|nr:cation diffusion facilitator family transporter [Lentilactobacillus sunkii]KRK86935.1 cation diffusion facilitator family transporter [Lentilactobacillus sunkii DSM 19904]
MANTNQYDAGRNVQKDRQHRLYKLQEAQQITWVNLSAYSAIMVAELIIGYMAQITVLIADGLNNLTGVCGAAILIIGLKISKRPPDSNHVMGHWQYENIAALLSATIMFAVSIQIFVDGAFAVQRFLAGHTIRPNYWSLGVSIVAAGIISILARFNRIKGIQLKNQSLAASGQDLKSDAWTSFGTFLSIGGAYLGAQWLDGVATLIVGCLILHSSISIFRTTIMRLSEGFDPRDIQRYSKTISTIPGILGIQGIEPRWLGDQIVMKIGIYLADDTDLKTSYAIGEKVEHALMKKYDILDADVMCYPVSQKSNPRSAD